MRLVQRVARARQAARQPAAGEYPGLRAGRVAGGRREDRRPRRPGGRHARPGDRRPYGRGHRPLFRLHRRPACPSAPAASPSSAKPPRCGKIFRKAAAAVRRVLPAPDVSRRSSSPRSRGSPWGPSPTARPIRRPRSPRSSSTTSPPRRPITWSRKGKAETVRALTAPDLARFHDKYFVPEHMVVTIFGDIEPDACRGPGEETLRRLVPRGGAEDRLPASATPCPSPPPITSKPARTPP